MSKLSKEELLKELDKFVFSDVKLNISRICIEEGHKHCQAYQQIKEMIQKPEVTEEFIDRWMDTLSFSAIPLNSGKIDISGDDLIRMLKEAGYEVAKPVTEKWIEDKALVALTIAHGVDLVIHRTQIKEFKAFIRSLVKELT